MRSKIRKSMRRTRGFKLFWRESVPIPKKGMLA